MEGIYDATIGWGFSAAWDRAMRRAENSGLRELRRQVLTTARGRTLDIGAGTGANIGLFPAAVTELFFVEPDVHMIKKMRPKVLASGSRAGVLAAGAEDLPFEDSSIDTVAFALSLCTIPDPAAALDEVARVLRPGGRVLFLEHVLSRNARLSRLQNRLVRQWHFVCDGCYCNRDTLATIEVSPLTVEQVGESTMHRVPPLVRPLIHGSAILR
jgi:ubiquinone/menaquinone biosynthesis C-methylase UbiE